MCINNASQLTTIRSNNLFVGVLVALFLAWQSMPVKAANIDFQIENLPPVKPSRSLYPIEWIRQGIEGQVLVLFNIDAQGKPINVAVYTQDNPKLSINTLANVGLKQFDVPSDWAASGKDRLRFALTINYTLANKDKPCVEGPPPPFWSISMCHAYLRK